MGGNMKLTTFIRENREEIDAAIKRACPNVRLSNQERCLWILNDEELYLWARSEGVTPYRPRRRLNYET